jgi:hypothetical protein
MGKLPIKIRQSGLNVEVMGGVMGLWAVAP